MSPMTSTHCRRCGTPTAGDVRFCAACGQRLGVADAGGGADDPLLARIRASLLNEYDVACEIGRGGMAAVFLAEDLRLPRRVALKVMLPELAYSAVMPARFVAEARTAAMLDHPNIVPVFHAGEQDGLRYFAMRFIDGCSLEQLQRAHGGLPVSLACHILSEVASALAYAHAVGVVHRDVKPSNVMIDRRWGRAIVTDFGIARVTDGQRLTSTGLAIGTPEYMSPEQYSNDHLTGASDQYALGAVAYQLLAGRPPFLGSQAEVLVAHLREPPPALRTLRPEVPMTVDALVGRMLAKDPADRWPSLAELATRFAEQVGTSPLTLREQLVALVPERTPGDGLPQTPVSPMSPVPGFRGPDPLALGGASLAVPAGAPVPSALALPPAPVPVAAAPAAPPVAASPSVAPVQGAALASALDVTPRLKDTGYTPRPVAPAVADDGAASGAAAGAAAGASAAPALQPTGFTPRGMTPIRPSPAVPATPPAAVEETTAEHEPVDGTEEYETPSESLEQHRAWLQPEPKVPVAPRRRKGLLVSGGLAAMAAVTAVTLFALDGTPVETEGTTGPVVTDTSPLRTPNGVDTTKSVVTGSDSVPGAVTDLADTITAPAASVVEPSAQRLVVVDAPQQRGRPLQLRDTLRLSARLVDGRRQAIAHSGVIRWSSDAPHIVEVDQSGLLTARAPQGRATITVRIDSSRVRVPVRVAPPVVATAEPAVARTPPPPAALSADEAHRLVESVADAARAQRVDALRALLAAGPGGPSPARLLETIAKERELTVELETRAFTSDADHPTQRAGLKLSWKRGGLGGKIKGERDNKTADLVVRFEREGTGWRVQSLQLEREFKP